MPLYDNVNCPVCSKKFEEGDDIVYCPECGTPHHRECYKAVGHCVNRGLHKSGYSFYDDMKAKQESQEEKQEEFYTPPVFPSFKAEENENSAQPFATSNQPQLDSVYDKDDQKIDGESVSDFAAAIRTNIPRFINLFKEFEYKGRKFSWNWGAFFFGSLYLFFRKMYKQGSAFLCAFIAVVYSSAFALIKFAPKYIEAMQDFYNLYAQNKAAYADIQALANVSDFSVANRIFYISLGVILVLRIIQALFADRFYKSTVSSMIKSVSEQLGNGASFMQTSIFPTQNSDLTQLQMKRLYLARRGGTNFFTPMLAAMAVYILMVFI